jgi:hypothetical protein
MTHDVPVGSQQNLSTARILSSPVSPPPQRKPVWFTLRRQVTG